MGINNVKINSTVKYHVKELIYSTYLNIFTIYLTQGFWALYIYVCNS